MTAAASVYASADWAAFVRALRAAPEDATVPLVAADWLDDHGKGDHARFVRGCGRLSELLREGRREMRVTGRGWPGVAAYWPYQELCDDLRALIGRYCHEWMGGATRQFPRPWPTDWPLGFLRQWAVAPLRPGCDRESDPHARRRLENLLARQPVTAVRLLFPRSPFAPPAHHVRVWGERFPGVTVTA